MFDITQGIFHEFNIDRHYTPNEICSNSACFTHFYDEMRYICIYTANVCRDVQGLCGEIGVLGFQIYGDCMYTRNPCNF